jgi:uridine phosphorylase
LAEINFNTEREYHVDLKSGEIAPIIFLVGDPNRAKKFSSYFTDIQVSRFKREFVTYTGLYEDIRITVMGIGIGPSNVEIVLNELSHITKEPLTVIRLGTCGGLSKKVKNGDFVISTGAVRYEDTSLLYVDPSYPAIAHYELISVLIEAFKMLNISNYHVGLTLTTSGFYGTPHDLIKKIINQNVLNIEMESSVLFTLATLFNFKAGTICGVVDNHETKTALEKEKWNDLEEKIIRIGLQTAKILNS